MRKIIYDNAGDALAKRHRGTMPIILTCSHGGTKRPAGLSERRPEDTPVTCTGGNAFATGRDNFTAEITEAVAQKIFDLTGLSPYVVIATFRRRYIDANRPPECAFTTPTAQPFYDEYHDHIIEFVTEILAQNQNRGFLFDIHGTARDDFDLYLGTRNGATLVNGITRADLFLQHGLQGLLTLAGTPHDIPLNRYNVSPPNAATNDFGPLSGGFTVEHYSATNQINCIQIEIRDVIRDDEELRDRFKDDLALALINFVRRYAPF